MKLTHRTMLAGTTATLIAALLAAGSGAAHAQTPPPPKPCTTVHIGDDGAIAAPSTIGAGITHISVTGVTGGALQLVAPRHGASVSTLVSDYQQFADTGLPGPTDNDFRFVGGSFTGTDLYLDLSPGTYYAFDAAQSTLQSSYVATVHVRGPVRSDANFPASTGSVTAVPLDKWSAHPAAIGSHGYLLFTNADTQTHLVNLLQLTPGTTLADVKAALAEPDGDVSTLSTGVYTELGVLSPGARELVSYTLPAGTYAVLDLWPDDTTGQPHSALGMVRLIHVN